MVKPEGVETLLYRCATWALLKVHVIVPYTTGCCFKPSEPGEDHGTATSSPAATLMDKLLCKQTYPLGGFIREGELSRMDYNNISLPKRILPGTLENTGHVGEERRRRNARTAWQRTFGCQGSRDQGIVSLYCSGSRDRYGAATEHAKVARPSTRRLMVTRVGGDKAFETPRRTRKGGAADNLEATVGSLRRFRAALVRSTQGCPKRRRLHRQGSLRTLRVLCYRC